MDCARILFLLAPLALCGCAQHARLHVFKPAAHDLTGVERIAILDFPEPMPGAKAAREVIVAEFVENRSFTLVEPAVLQATLPATDDDLDRNAALIAARHAGVDAILDLHMAKTVSDPSDNITAGHWTAELIDVRSGEVIAESKSSVTGAAKGANVEQFAAGLVKVLAPHYAEIEVQLARQRWGEGRARVAAGNSLARQGEWIAAAEAWEQARQANPGNHAALHNLALVAEARQDYRLAFQLLDQALAQFPARLYHQTRSEMEGRQTTYLTAVKQVEAIREAARARSAPPGVTRRPETP